MVARKIRKTDPHLCAAIEKEVLRQQQTLELIASENIVSAAVTAAQGSVLTNKYAEGYPCQRYYGGCKHVDEVESLAIERARRLYHAAWVNVQPHSGSQANMAVLFALLEPGDRVMGMNLSCGGHLTHGSPANFSGKLFRFAHYGVDPATERIDFSQVRRLARRHRPKMIIAGASAYPRIIDFKAFAEIAAETGALLMVDMAHIAGLVAAGLHPSPIPLADVVTTTTHKTLRGPRGGMILSRSTDIGHTIDRQIFPGIQGGPLMHVIGAKAVALKEALAPDFISYQQQVVQNARILSERLLHGGVRLVSGGTDNHMILADLSALGITGKDAESALEDAGITVNKNRIPFDPRGPAVTSGIRLGTPAVTSRGMGAPEIKIIGDGIVAVLQHPGDARVANRVRGTMRELCDAFPMATGAA